MAADATEQANRAGMDPQRLVVGAYLVFAIVLSLFLGRILTLIWTRWNLPNQEILAGANLDVPTLLGVVLGVGLMIFSYVHPAVKDRAMESANELMKVTWPSWAETRTSTVAVIIASFVAAVILFAIDRLAYQIMVDWLPTLWGSL